MGDDKKIESEASWEFSLDPDESVESMRESLLEAERHAEENRVAHDRRLAAA